MFKCLHNLHKILFFRLVSDVEPLGPQQFVSCSLDGTMALWDIRAQKRACNVIKPQLAEGLFGPSQEQMVRGKIQQNSLFKKFKNEFTSDDHHFIFV